jgi:putative transposase
VLGFARSTYYEQCNRKPKSRAQESARLEVEISAAFKSHQGRYGSPRIHQTLKRAGYPCSKRRVEMLMRKLNLAAKQPKRFRRTSACHPEHKPNENMLQRNFQATCPNEVWVGDVTYIWTKKGWAYLAMLKDMYCQTVVGWAVGPICNEALTRKALEHAIGRRHPIPGLIHHTDRGATYTAHAYRKRLKDLGIRQSMSRRGDCWDNAPAESLNGTVKREALADFIPFDVSHVHAIISDYIDSYYNVKRLHSSTGYLTPQEKYLAYRVA